MKSQNDTENTAESERKQIQNAYAYSRVSTTRQLSGTGMSRQQEGKPEEICQQHKWTLSEQTFGDFGVSAHKGKNRLQGDLATFIQLAKDKKLLPNPVLILEQWDRFSREDIDESEAAIMDLLKTGVAIHIAFSNQTFTKSSTKSIGDRVSILIACKAAYEYSANLSKRVGAAYAKKKAMSLETGKPYRFRCFAWLKWNEDKKEYETIPEKVESVKRLFELANIGYGVRTITRTLNQEKVPYIGAVCGKKIKSKGWANVSVQRILRGKEVLGFNSHTDPPVKMFPAIILRIPTVFGQRSDFSRTVIRFISDAVPI
jgi:DNA invertase Pin-like site-specific DNA recombinase